MMSNTLQDLIDTTIMPLALPVLREACVMPALVRTDFRNVAAAPNDTIRIPLPQDLGTASDMDTSAVSDSTGIDDAKVDVKLDKWKYKQFQMADDEIRSVSDTGVLPSAAEAAVKSLANAVGADLIALYKDIPYSFGTAGVTPDADEDIIGARKMLSEQLAPTGDRRLVLDTDAEAKFLKIYNDADATGSTAALREGALGRLFGFDTYVDQLLSDHAFGSFADGSPTVDGIVAAGASVMNVTGGAGTETFRKGDLFTVADAPGQYVVTKDATAEAGDVAGLAFYPPAPAGGFATGKAITVIAPVSGTAYANNLAFHRDAFAFVARPLFSGDTAVSESSTISVQSDPVSGIPLRLETWREPGQATRFWRFDILYGVQTLRPELAVRLLG